MKQILAAVLVVVACVASGGLSAAVGAQEVFTPGKDVTTPTVVKQVKPVYTPEAQRARIEGTVLMYVTVQADGAVGTVAIERSLDSAFGLDQEALKAMKQWTFNPGLKDGKPVAVRVHVEMTFTLK